MIELIDFLIAFAGLRRSLSTPCTACLYLGERLLCCRGRWHVSSLLLDHLLSLHLFLPDYGSTSKAHAMTAEVLFIHATTRKEVGIILRPAKSFGALRSTKW
jgi:hypothetical protein